SRVGAPQEGARRRSKRSNANRSLAGDAGSAAGRPCIGDRARTEVRPMSDLATYIQLGFRHIVDVEAMDHILFLVALAAIYRLRDARDALWVITAFTVGHSITLALAVTGALTLPPAVIEFLIPITLVATGIEHL